MRILFFILYLFVYSMSHAIERIDINQGNIDPMPIASIKFFATNHMHNELGKEITQVINNDLQGTGLFRIINEEAYIERIPSVKHRPKFAAWRQINASALIVGEILSDGREMKVEYQLWDPYTESSLKSYIYQSKEKDWRRVAHKIADDIYKRVTGEEGYFNTKILFIAASGPAKNRIKKLAIMDQDGADMKYLTDGKNLVLTPRFAPDNHNALYLFYAKHKAPRVHLRNLNTGNDKILGHFKGMTFSPRFSSDGKEVAMSAAINGSSQIFIMDLAAKHPVKLTTGTFINTNPFFSPDGNKITFVSDRSGTAQIYIMNKDGSEQQRISFGDKGSSYFTPIWSPRGDYIAFTKKYKGMFYIGVMRPDGSGERMLTQGYLVESPVWSPNGRVIMYTREDRYRGNNQAPSSKLCTVDITGNFDRTLQIPSDASDPSWSNLLN
jgi:TolB protein